MTQRPPLVLIVEDHEDLRWITTELVERHGLRAACARDGREGVELALSLAPAVLLLDLAMPRMSGLDVLKAIKAAPNSTRVIVLSGHADPTTQREALEAGADLFLVKPVEPSELLRSVDQLLAAPNQRKRGRTRRPK